MPGRRLPPEAVPTPGPWLVRGEAEASTSPEELMLGVEPATNEQPGGWPYFIRRDAPLQPGDTPLHVATGIQRLADAKLMAAAPDMAATLLRLLTSPPLMKRDLDPATRAAIDTAWALLVKVAPHLEIGA